MKATRSDAIVWIDKQDTKLARTDQEKAKYLVGKLVPGETPHPALW